MQFQNNILGQPINKAEELGKQRWKKYSELIGHSRGKSSVQIFSFGESPEVDNGKQKQEEGKIHPAIDANYYKGYSSQRKMIQTFQNSGKEIARVYDIKDLSPTLKSKTDGWQEPKVAIPVLTPDRKEKRQNGRRFKTDEEPMFTLNGQDRHGIFNGVKIRRITPLEAERLQGFPDNFTQGVSDSRRYKMMGNAVTTNVIEWVIKSI